MPKKIRGYHSQCPFEIRMFKENKAISTGTAFFFECSGEIFLITNWHNLSGRNAFTKQPLSKIPDNFPTHIEAGLSSYGHGKVQLPSGHFTTIFRKIDIYGATDNGLEPLWYEHPQLGSTCDIAALRLGKPPDVPTFMHNPANTLSSLDIPIKPGGVAFIIGFPSSLSVGFGLPIWKSGFIASEPTYDVCIGGDFSPVGGMAGGIEIPAFFIDSQTRSGMSGSPVFASFTGNWSISNPYEEIDPNGDNFWNRKDIALHHTASGVAPISTGHPSN